MPEPAPGWINDGQHDAEVARFVVEGDNWVHAIVKGARDELRALSGVVVRFLTAEVRRGKE